MRFLHGLLAAVAVALVAASASAQNAPVSAVAPAQSSQLDPRLAAPEINALSALVALREAELRALAEDAAKERAADAGKAKGLADWWAGYVKGIEAQLAAKPAPAL